MCTFPWNSCKDKRLKLELQRTRTQKCRIAKDRKLKSRTAKVPDTWLSNYEGTETLNWNCRDVENTEPECWVLQTIS